MVRSIGIDPGDRAVKVVELDGSYRKTRLVRAHVAPVVGADDDPARVEHVAAGVREAIDAGMKGDVSLGFPCREAVLRTIELPFKGADAIRKVVKSEIETEIYTHSVDDMVVDFHEIGESSDGATRILVAAVPKDGLRSQLEALSAEGVEPDTVDLDAMALWRAAHWAGAFDAIDTDAAEEDEREAVHAVLDIGSRSVRLILVEGEELVEMRALRLGESVVADQIARQYGADHEAARDAVLHSLDTGEDVHVAVAAPVADAEPGAAGLLADGPPAEEAAAAEGPGEVLVPHDEIEAAHTKFLQRLARELTRFLTATEIGSRIDKVWVTGAASQGRGVREMLVAVFGMEPEQLDLLGNLSHDLDDEQVEELGPQLASAIGLALTRMGGPSGFQMRREDLALVHGFDAIKFPLAIACMFALLAMFVYSQRQQQQLKQLELEIGRQYVDPDKPEEVIFHGMLNPIFRNNRWFENRDYFGLRSRKNPNTFTYDFKKLQAEVLAAPVHERVKIVRDRLREVAAQKQKDSGVYEDISLESGLAVLVRWAEILKGVEPELGRYLVTEIDLSMRPRSRSLTFDVVFRGSDFRSKAHGILKAAIEADMQQPDSPFGNTDSKSLEVTEALFDDKDNPDVTGATFTFVVPVKDSFNPFGA